MKQTATTSFIATMLKINSAGFMNNSIDANRAICELKSCLAKRYVKTIVREPNVALKSVNAKISFFTNRYDNLAIII